MGPQARPSFTCRPTHPRGAELAVQDVRREPKERARHLACLLRDLLLRLTPRRCHCFEHVGQQRRLVPVWTRFAGLYAAGCLRVQAAARQEKPTYGDASDPARALTATCRGTAQWKGASALASLTAQAAAAGGKAVLLLAQQCTA